MIVIRRDCTAVVDVQDDEWANLRHELRRLVGALTALFNPVQLNYAFRMNVDAQVHLHVIPRYATACHWRGLVFADVHWRSAFGDEQRVLDSDALTALAGQVRDHSSPRTGTTLTWPKPRVGTRRDRPSHLRRRSGELRTQLHRRHRFRRTGSDREGLSVPHRGTHRPGRGSRTARTRRLHPTTRDPLDRVASTTSRRNSPNDENIDGFGLIPRRSARAILLR